MSHPYRTPGLIVGSALTCVGVVIMFVYLRGSDLPAAAQMTSSASGPAIDTLLSGRHSTATENYRQEVPIALDSDQKPPARAAPEARPRLEAVKDELSVFATDSVYGKMYLNAVLERALELASQPIENHPDFDYEDDDAVAYTIHGLPDGMEGHMLVGLQPYTENGRTYRYVQMDIDIPTTEPDYLDGVLRDGPSMGLSISYDIKDPGTPVRVALLLQRRVDLSGSRGNGIDAYTGSYTQGGYYWHDLLNPTQGPSALTFGIVDGSPATGAKFPLASPLWGDLQLDQVLLGEVLGQLQKNLSLVKGE